MYLSIKGNVSQIIFKNIYATWSINVHKQGLMVMIVGDIFGTRRVWIMTPQ